MISEGGVTLGFPKKIHPKTFFSNKDDEELDSFIIALAAWFNDLKTYQLHMKQAEALFAPHENSTNRSPKDEMEIRLARSYVSHASRLIASHLNEFLVTIDENKKLLKHQTFRNVLKTLPKNSQLGWIALETVLFDDGKGEVRKKEFHEFKKLLVRMRSNGTYHYNQIKYFKDGYLAHNNNPENDPYYCSADAPGGTRFFFADRVQETILNEMGEAPQTVNAFRELLSIAQPGVKDLVESYIKAKEATLRTEKYSEWTFKKHLE